MLILSSYLILETLGHHEADEEEISFIGSHIGCSAGIVTLLRAFPHNISMVYGHKYTCLNAIILLIMTLEFMIVRISHKIK